MTAPFKVFIPARYASTRLPGKPLLAIGEWPLIRHVYEAARQSRASEVVIVTDDERIRNAAEGFGATVCMTSPDHESGSERIGEALIATNEDDETVIVNVQGDEYGLPPALIDQVAAILQRDAGVPMATLCEAITDPDEFRDPHVVKLVMDREGLALYFSRAPIPAQRREAQPGFSQQPWRHIGLYAYRAGFLKAFADLPACELEQSERLEQLRALYHGYAIRVEPACESGGLGVDSEADLERARKTATSHKLQATRESD